MGLKFSNRPNPFRRRLDELAAPYLDRYGTQGTHRLHLKAAIFMFAWFATYYLLATINLAWYLSIPLLFLFGIIIAGIGFNIMHDAVHGSFSRKKWLNQFLGLWLNLLGGNADIWKTKHNEVHHTYTNINGYDTDINIPYFGRFHPSQKWYPWMVHQHRYLWYVYALFGYSSWIWYSDFITYFKGTVGNSGLHFTIKNHFMFWLSKIAHATVFIIIPCMFHPFWMVVLGYFVVTSIVGLTISTVFQLAHVVESTQMIDAPSPFPGTKHSFIEHENAVHQILTTANFATNNKLLSWYVGGLNFQIEHHLFPKVSHEYYPQLSLVVRHVCKEFNLPYNEFPTISRSIISHNAILKKLGQKPDPQLV